MNVMAAQAPTFSVKSSFPIDFALYDQNSHYVLYITDTPSPEHSLNVELKNTSGEELVFAPLSGPAARGNCHFELRFRKGTLSKKTLDLFKTQTAQAPMLVNAGWEVQLGEVENDAHSLYFLCTHPEEFFKQARRFTNQALFTLTLQHIGAQAGSGARGTNVEFIPHHITYGGKARLTGKREQHLFITNHSGQKNIPLLVGFAGSNRILNDGAPHDENTLTLRIQNVTRPGKDHSQNPGLNLSGSMFVLSFDTDASSIWALCTPDELDAIHFQPRKSALYHIKRETQGQSIEWTITFQKDIVIAPGEKIDITLLGFQSSLGAGLAHMVVNYHNIPGYRDGHFVLTIEKSPLLFSSLNYTGIGVAAPSANLDVAGMADTLGQVSLQLRSGNSAGETGSTQIALGFNGTDQFRHAIKSRHNNDDPSGNAIDFYVWDQSDGNLDAIGSLHSMTLEAGKVGIGITSPTAVLDVAGSADTPGQVSLHLGSGNSIGDNGSSQITLGFSGSSQYRHAIQSRHSGDMDLTSNAIDFYIWDQAAGDPDAIGSLHSMTLAAGSVGIGTLNPACTLDVNGSAQISGPLSVKGMSQLGQVSIAPADPDAALAYLDVAGSGDSAGQVSLHLRSGNSTGETGSSQITLGYSGTNQYRHAIKSRHNALGTNDNAIDFYTWDQAAGDADAIGSLHTMSLVAGSVGIGTPDPAYTLEVIGGETRLQQQDWQPIELAEGWEPENELANPPAYFMDSLGIVHLRGNFQRSGFSTQQPDFDLTRVFQEYLAGVVAATTPSDQEVLIFSLPEGYQPEYVEELPASTFMGFSRVRIYSDGRVTVPPGSANLVRLGGLTFRAHH